MLWPATEASLVAKFARQDRSSMAGKVGVLFGSDGGEAVEFGDGVGRAGRTSQLLDFARHKLVGVAQRLGLQFKQALERISKGKSRKSYEFGMTVGLTVTHKGSLMVGARSFPGSPYDGHALAEQLEQLRNQCLDIGVRPKAIVVELGYRGLDAENQGVQITHRGQFQSLTALQRRWLKRCQGIQPAIGHTKAAHRIGQCWRQRALSDALHALSWALVYNIRWLMLTLVTQARKALSCLLQMGAVQGRQHFAESRERPLLELLSGGSLQLAQPFTGLDARVLSA